jgi:hypothetical protein
MEKYVCMPFYFTQKEDSLPKWIHIQLSLTPRETEIMFICIRKSPLFFQKRYIDLKLFKLLHPPYHDLTSFEYMILLRRYLINHCYGNDNFELFYYKPLFMVLGIEEGVEKISYLEYIFRVIPLFGYSFGELDSYFKTKPTPTLNEFQKIVQKDFFKKIN